MVDPTTRGYPQYDDDSDSDLAAKFNALGKAVNDDVDRYLADTDWVACGQGNANVSGTAKVKRIGSWMFGDLSLAYSGGWPNSQITAFTLPDPSFSPGGNHPHRMPIGGAIQSTAGGLVLIATPGANAVFVGANGGAGNIQLYWYGPLWAVK